MTKTTSYIVAIIVLLAMNLALFFNVGGTKRKTDVTFLDATALSQLERISIRNNQQEIVLQASGEGWILNDKYAVDRSFMNTLLSVLERIQVVREVGNWEESELGSIELGFASNTNFQFHFAANGTRTKSYFITNGLAKEVVVPGYRDNVVDIFMMHPDQWRDRLVFDGSWRSIQKLEVKRGSEEPLKIVFEDQFFMVNGEAPQDSSAVVEYLNQFQYFEANERISDGRFPRFDSLAQTTPGAVITIEDIKEEQPVILTIFPNLKGQAYHLVMRENQMMVIDARRVQGLLPTPQDFLRKN